MSNTYYLELTDNIGRRVALQKVNLDGDDIAVDEYTLVRRAKNLYRDFLYAKGEWTPENHAKLKDYWK